MLILKQTKPLFVKRFIIACITMMLCTGTYAQDNFAFWKKDRAYAENAFSVNTAGPIPSVGFQLECVLEWALT